MKRLVLSLILAPLIVSLGACIIFHIYGRHEIIGS